MVNQRHVDILLRDGVAVWNLWRKEEPEIEPDPSVSTLLRAFAALWTPVSTLE